MDWLEVLLGDKYEFVFLFDNSSGHVKKRVNGLDAVKMNKIFGGLKQHPTLIKMKQGYLGPFHYPKNPNIVQVGEMQSLVWLASELNSDEDGPLYLPPQKPRIEREDRIVPVKLKKDQTEFEPKEKTGAELIK